MDLPQDHPGSSFLMMNQLNHLIKLPTVMRKKILKSKMRETSMMMLFKTMDSLLEPAGFKLEILSKWMDFLKDTELWNVESSTLINKRICCFRQRIFTQFKMLKTNKNNDIKRIILQCLCLLIIPHI